MSFRLCPGARLILACALVAGASSSAFGQATPAPAQPPVQVPPSTTPSAKGLEPTGPVRQLSIEEAVNLALEQNLGIQIERFNPELQDLNTAQILSNYVPRFGAGAFTQSQDQPPSSFLSGGDTTITSDNFGFTTNIAKLFPWGTEATVAFDSGRPEDQQLLFELQPDVDGQPRRRRHTAAAAQLQVRHRAPAVVRLAQEPGDRRRRSAADRRADHADREELPIGTTSTRSTR